MKKIKQKLENNIKKIALKISQIYISIRKKETPWYAKVLGFITVGYFLSPIDLIPDFVPVLGYIDDLIILPVLIYLCIKLIPKDIFEQSYLEAKNIWKDKHPSKWYFAIPIMIIWTITIVFVIRLIVK